MLVRRCVSAAAARAGSLSAAAHGVWAAPRGLPARGYAVSAARLPRAALSGQVRWSSGAVSQKMMDSVVKVFATLSKPNYLVPWTRKVQQTATGSGFVVDASRRLLITNAHVILDAALIEVRREGSGDKFVAKLVYVSVDSDLALLTVAEEEFWTELTALPLYFPKAEEVGAEAAAAAPAPAPAPAAKGRGGRRKQAPAPEGTPASTPAAAAHDLRDLVAHAGPFDGIPEIQQAVKVIGYPLGGDQISVTSGVVSRVDMQAYAVCVHTHLMAIQIDAALNPGNSGGPAVANDRVIGVSFQSLSNADSISYIIPVPIIAHFLRVYFETAGKNAPLFEIPTAEGNKKKSGGKRKAAQAEEEAAAAAAAAASKTKKGKKKRHGKDGQPDRGETVVQAEQLPLLTSTYYHPGFCTLGCFIQEPVNEHLRQQLGLKRGQTGVLVREVLNLPKSAAKGVIKENDVLLSVDGKQISNDGTIKFGQRRISFSHLLHIKGYGERVPIEIFRNKRVLKLAVDNMVTPPLVHSHIYNPYFDQKPKYLAFGGVVFTPLTIPYLKEWGPDGDWYNNCPRHLLQAAFYDHPSPGRTEVVVLEQILTHKVNQGYQPEHFQHHALLAVNDVKIRSLQHLDSILTTLPADGYVRFSIGNAKETGCMVLHVGAAREADHEVLEFFNIPKLKHI